MRAVVWFLAALIGFASAGLFETKKDGVVAVTEDKDFDREVLKDAYGVQVVAFYAPWCGHCKSLKAEFEKAGRYAKGFVKFVAVDADANKGLASKYGVQGFPTIKIFGENKASPTDYSGNRDGKSMVEAGVKEMNRIMARRAGGGGSAGALPTKEEAARNKKGGSGNDGLGKAVVKASSKDFDDIVLGAAETVAVEFFAPWCGHCKTLAPEWAKAAEEADGEIKFVAVDADADRTLGSRFSVQGFPTIKIFPAGKKVDASAVEYTGVRDAASILAEARRINEAAGGSPGKVTQLTSAAVFAENCEGPNRICVVAFLPHILDDKASKRKERIDALAAAAGKVGKRGLFRFFWAESGAHPELEETFNIGLVPAVVALSTDKKIYINHRGAFDVTPIHFFAQALSVKVEGAQAFPKGWIAKAAVETVPDWDGEDAEAEVVDEISLDDL